MSDGTDRAGYISDTTAALPAIGSPGRSRSGTLEGVESVSLLGIPNFMFQQRRAAQICSEAGGPLSQFLWSEKIKKQEK
jgi:hypothetical protein